MPLTRQEQETITRDLASAVKILIGVKKNALNGLDQRAIAMAFVVLASAIVKSSGNGKNAVDDMVFAAWNGELVDKVT